ncbi:MAG: wax ester/triacylglycerol synthase family O-acyltransferase [Myxococcota bacterium]
MPRYMYDRLSAQDNGFLVVETDHVPMHVAAIGIYSIGDLAGIHGGIDVRRFKRALEAQLHRIPRYRQKLQWVPIEQRPVWVDDEHFNIDYHVRHAALPRPGGIEELKKLAARITTRKLDRTRPLWEMWLIEGLSDDRFAMVSKIHHCMVDGQSGADVAQILMSPSPEQEPSDPRPFRPRPSPSANELLWDAFQRRLGLPLRLAGELNDFRDRADDLASELGTRLRAFTDLAARSLVPSSSTPLNGQLGPHRRVDWLTLPLADIKRLKNELGCTVNDVALATVSGAVRQYLIHRGVEPDGVDFRISAPVNVRKKEEEGKLGNRVSAWIVSLPLDESDPLKWIERVHEDTSRLKESRQALAIDMIMAAAEYMPPSWMGLAARAAASPINMIVTNVAGPQFPLYLLGARLEELHPLVPLMEGTGLGIALFSYDGKLHVGLNADYEMVPDLGIFTALFAQAFMALSDAAAAKHRSQSSSAAPLPAKKKRRRRPTRAQPVSSQGGDPELKVVHPETPTPR